MFDGPSGQSEFHPNVQPTVAAKPFESLSSIGHDLRFLSPLGHQGRREDRYVGERPIDFLVFRDLNLELDYAFFGYLKVQFHHLLLFFGTAYGQGWQCPYPDLIKGPMRPIAGWFGFVMHLDSGHLRPPKKTGQ